MTTPRIVVCTNAYLPADQEGGPPFSAAGLCRALAAAGADVHVLTTDRNGTGRLDVPTDRWSRHDGLPVWYARSLAGPYYPAPSAGRALASIDHIDCVIGSGTLWTHLGWAGWRATRRRRLPGIVIPRGLLNPWALNFKPGRKRAYWMIAARRMIAEAAAVVALTEHERGAIDAMRTARRIEVIPNGIRIEDFSQPPPRSRLDEWFPRLANRRFVLFLGRVHENKGLPALIGSLERSETADLDWMLVVAGPVYPDYRPTFDRLLASARVADRILLAGPVSGARKFALLAHAAAFVLPSLSEALPVAVLEALASGCPVVLTPDCHLPEVAAAGAGIETRSDAASIAAALRRLLSDDAFARALGERGRQLAGDRFGWRSVGEAMLALCRDAAASS